MACSRDPGWVAPKGARPPVGVIFSADTDLVRTLEVVASLKGPTAREVASWKPDNGPASLSMPRMQLRCHYLPYLDRAAYEHVYDSTACTAARLDRLHGGTSAKVTEGTADDNGSGAQT